MESITSTPDLLTALSRRNRAWRDRARGGAIGGRGYHFQDATLAWLLALGVGGQLPVNIVVPEGFDDASAIVDEAVVEVQVKSRQPHLGAVPSSLLAEWVGDLGQRHIERLESDPARRLILIVERGVPESTLDGSAAEVPELRALLDEPLAKALGADQRELILARLHVLVVESPLTRAAEAIATGRRLGPATAVLAAQRLIGAVAAAADANALPNAPAAGIAVTDAAAIVEQVVEIVDVEQLDRALSMGLCEAVDFSQPDADERYLHGVATTPGHVAAGIVVDRPTEVEQVTTALSERKRCLIVGPSGQGKSALAWLSVYATRHVIRWYRIRTLPPDGPVALDRLTRSLVASVASPVGFVLDDVGRLGPEGWDRLLEEVRPRPGVVLLGTCREEDIHEVRTLPDVGLVRPELEPPLAKEIWSRLHVGGATSWKGWAEPLSESRNLVLEYTHLLTEGDRLETIIGAQVRRLFREGREAEVGVLQVVAVADLLGTALPVVAIARAAGLTEAAVRDAARRLANELLVRVRGDVVGGLHELRSRAASDATHEQGFADMAATVAGVLQELSVHDLANAVRRAAASAGGTAVLVESLARRVGTSAHAHDLAEALRGLRLVEQDVEARAAVAELVRQVPAGELAETVWTRLGGRPLHDSVVLSFAPAASLKPPTASARCALLDLLEIQLGSLAGLERPETVTQLLIGLLGTKSPMTASDAVRDVASRLELRRGGITSFLDAARSHGADVHRAAIDGVGGPAAAMAAVAADHEGLALSAARPGEGSVNVLSRANQDAEWWRGLDASVTNDVMAALIDVTEVCITRVDLLDRRIPHLDWRPERRGTTSPSHSSPRAERRVTHEWRGAVLAAAGAPRWTDRLAHEVPLMTALATATEELLLTVATGRAIPTRLTRNLEKLGRRATRLPPEPAERLPSESPSQPGAAAEPDPVVALVADPSRLLLAALRSDPMHAAVIAHRLWRIAEDLTAAGRWALLPTGDDARSACARSAAALHALRAVASEHARGGTRERLSIRAAAKHAAPADAPRAATEAARRAGDARVLQIAARLEHMLAKIGRGCSVTIIRPDTDEPAIVWPPGELVATIDLTSAAEWPATVATVVAARNDLVDPNRSVAVVVRVEGNLSDHLSGEVARAWWGRRGVPANVGVRAAPEPRLDALADGLAAAADLRWGYEHRRGLSDDVPVAKLVDSAMAGAETRLDAARRELERLGCAAAASAVARLAQEGMLSDELAAETEQLRLELADKDLTRRELEPRRNGSS